MIDLALVMGGVLAGLINAIAGGGSTVTLPLLLLVGVDASVANGTNRVAVLFQSLSATRSFSAHGAVNWRVTFRLLPFVLGGAILGALIASDVNPEKLESVFGVVFIALGILLVSKDQLKRSVAHIDLSGVRWLVLIGIGFYGGFLQAGVGIPLLLTFMGLYGLNFADANGTKVVHIAIYSFGVLFVFGSADQVHTVYGLELAVGGVLGSHIGAKIVLKQEPKYLKPLLSVFLCVMGVRSLV